MVGSGVYADDISAHSWADARWLAIAFLAAAALNVLLAFLLIPRIVRPLAHATEVAADIAQGRLDGALRIESADETGRLLSAMSTMRNRIQDIADAQSEMKSRHDAGTISYRIDASAFPGAYAMASWPSGSTRWWERTSRSRCRWLTWSAPMRAAT